MSKVLSTENDVKAMIRTWLDDCGYFHFPVPANGLGRNGVSDRIVVIRPSGMILTIEAKRPGRRGEQYRGCSRNQFSFIKSIACAGGIGWVVDSQEDLDDLQAVITGVDPRRDNVEDRYV